LVRKDREHWLDTAKEKYDSRLVEEVKILLRVLLLFLPLPLFWALFKQQARLIEGFYTLI
jgi:solute carrier family 15 oligopeptide transporter 1